jgi:3' terminal RNA ribose 2'-O-methyltransferase Hen1
MVRSKKKQRTGSALEHYINDRPYAASSFLSVAIVDTFGAALNGKCKERPELVDQIMPLTVEISVVLVQGKEQVLRKLFEPLNYQLKIKNYPLDQSFPKWGQSNYYTIKMDNKLTVQDLLSHLYVLIPVLDNQKHYFVNKQEVDKLLSKGQGWLSKHPAQAFIVRRYLKYSPSLAREAISRLSEEGGMVIEEEMARSRAVSFEKELETKTNLNEERYATVLSVLKSHNVEQVIDLGCGEGKFLAVLLKNREFKKIVGMDVSIRSLEIAAKRLRMDQMAPRQKERIELIHGSLMYKDQRFSGFDVATVIEVIEHLDAPRLAAFERVLFEFAQPRVIVVTTPNIEYNLLFENLTVGKLRHGDHRFEWTRKEFQAWADKIAQRFHYQVCYQAVGNEDASHGAPSQMGIFIKK